MLGVRCGGLGLSAHRKEIESRLRLGDNSIGADVKLRKLLGALSTSKVHLVASGKRVSLCNPKRNMMKHSRNYSNVSMAELVALFGFDIFCFRCLDKLEIVGE